MMLQVWGFDDAEATALMDEDALPKDVVFRLALLGDRLRAWAHREDEARSIPGLQPFLVLDNENLRFVCPYEEIWVPEFITGVVKETLKQTVPETNPEALRTVWYGTKVMFDGSPHKVNMDYLPGVVVTRIGPDLWAKSTLPLLSPGVQLFSTRDEALAEATGDIKRMREISGRADTWGEMLTQEPRMSRYPMAEILRIQPKVEVPTPPEPTTDEDASTYGYLAQR